MWIKSYWIGRLQMEPYCMWAVVLLCQREIVQYFFFTLKRQSAPPPLSPTSSLHFSHTPHPLISYSPLSSLSLSCTAVVFDVKRSTIISELGLFVHQLRSAVCWDAKHTFILMSKCAD